LYAAPIACFYIREEACKIGSWNDDSE